MPSVVNGRVEVPVPGTPVAFSSAASLTAAASRTVRALTVVALPTNTGRVAFGGSDIDATEATLNGGWLDVGDTADLPPGADLDEWFVDAETADDGVSFYGVV